MIRFSLLFPVLLAVLITGCRGTSDPVNTSEAFSEGGILLGGIIAEQLAGIETADTFHTAGSDLLVPQIEALLDQVGSLKKSRQPVNAASFDSSWNRLAKSVMASFEDLSANDIREWITLNDTLLKYSGEVRFADELEKMAYNAPIPEVVQEDAVRSFCYTRMYDRVYVNLLGNSEVGFEHTTGGHIRFVQKTDYPFGGKISLTAGLNDTRYVDLFIRIPSWAKEGSVTLKGVAYNAVPGAYTEIARKWKNGDVVEVSLVFDTQVIRRDSSAFAFALGPVLLSYVAGPGELPVFRGKDPARQLREVFRSNDMITCNFTGIPGQTLVLQPFFARHDMQLKRRAWIRTLP